MDTALLLKESYVDPSIKPMTVVVSDLSIDRCFPKIDDFPEQGRAYGMFNDFKKVFRDSVRETIRKNLLFQAKSNTAYLSVLVRNVEYEFNGLWMWLSGGLIVGYFFGIPATSMTYTVEMEAAVMNRQGRVLKTYSTVAEDTEYAAFYWGYYDPAQVAYTKALIKACDGIREQLTKDAANINGMIK
ncbi:MAG: hypothetical protein MUD12_12865 [Spirochaetes bacterium]|nr:hypothetical protein [Spirochaetota bacterium]